ncbi:hypothetical protein [Microbacterium sp. Bi128]|uniref:hypothetical protein n=1 Tax=Microbacterium sp. Bi128 TaxID=2821115 RepID=UPI001D3E3492|nr:hypothetical protein [Microbacterium sp. Bi128]CAH0308841.1 hypothetical protein SRABI128_04435 [Microbacterium sp. Bi128]
MSETMERTNVEINDSTLALAQSENVTELKRNIVGALGDGGGFVDLTVVGNRIASVLFTIHTAVTITTSTVEFDSRDDGDSEAPFGFGTIDVDYAD